jgi:hypothetical protein
MSTADKPTRTPSTRTFWADVLAKASTEELVEIIETLEARRAEEGGEADSDLLVLARYTLLSRREPRAAR